MATGAARFTQRRLGLALALAALGAAAVLGGGWRWWRAAPLRPPPAPGDLLAYGVVGGVRLAWTPAAGATGYRVKRAAAPGGPYVEVGAAATPTARDAGPGAGATAFYVVSGVNAAGEGPDSAEAPATPAAVLEVPPEESTTANHVGLNTWFLDDRDGSLAFVDAAKHARPWQDARRPDAPVRGADRWGWPTADASAIFFGGDRARVDGTYRLVLEGQADVALLGSGGAVSGQAYSPATHTTTADVTFVGTATASRGLVLTGTRRTPGAAPDTGFTGLRLYRPGYPADGSVTFTRPFLEALRKGGVVRMMDWTLANRNLVQRWSERVTPRHASRGGPRAAGPSGPGAPGAGAGVALEHQIQLCNALLADCWINLPVLADDDYVRRVALALRYGTDGAEPYTRAQAAPAYPPLDPALRVYLEVGNELWNGADGFLGFPAVSAWVERLPEGHPLRAPPAPGRLALVWRYPALRIAAVSDVFRELFGDAAMMSRIRPLLMAKQGNGVETLSTALAWLEAHGRRQSPAREVRSYVFGAGGSAYYHGNAWPMRAPWDPAEYFAPGNHPSASDVRDTGVDAVWAASYGLRRVAYEGGPSLDGATRAEANALNLDPRMKDVVLATHDAWSANGGDLLVYYTVTGPHEWEFTPDLADLATPKLAALDALRARPRAPVSLGPALPGRLTPVLDGARADARIRSGADVPLAVGGAPCLDGNDVGEWVALPGHAAAPFTGRISVSGRAAADATLAVRVNGVRTGEVTLAGGGGDVRASTSLTADLPAGLVVIRLEALTAPFTLCGIDVR